MKKIRKKDEFLEHLRKIPIVQVACEKSSISRNSVYRWRNEDEKFKKEMETAMSEGENFVNDMSESQVLTLIKEKNWPAISFWLRHHHPRYKTKIEIEGALNIVEELNPEQKELVKKALELANLNLNQNDN